MVSLNWPAVSSSTPVLCRIIWHRFDRLHIAKNTEAGCKPNRIVYENSVTKHGLLTYIDEMTFVHRFDSKSTRIAERGELMYLLKCTIQGSLRLLRIGSTM